MNSPQRAQSAGRVDAVCEHGLERVVAKKHSSRYPSEERGWIKLKNPS
jgi:ATP-dependent DNA ligase